MSMFGAYCEICLCKLPSMRKLISHYLTRHSKFKLAREIVRLSIIKRTPKVLLKKNKFNIDVSPKKQRSVLTKSETLFVSENIHISYRNNEIIIRDDRSYVDMELSFDENSCDSKEFYTNSSETLDLKPNNNDKFQRGKNSFKDKEKKSENKNLAISRLQTSSSSVSSEESLKKIAFRRKIKKRRNFREKTKLYKINITRSRNNESLNENTGNFYYCTCRYDNNEINLIHSKITSDTESASDASKSNLYNPKVFCSKCGNGYSEESMLADHMKIHETHCRVCNEIFPTEKTFKEHIQSHFFKVFVCHICNYEFPVKSMLHKHFNYHYEDSILESVIDMENDYNLAPCPLPSMSYQTSINNILFYLGENHEI